jgi:L-lactate dehydrogenase complex protein LldE
MAVCPCCPNDVRQATRFCYNSGDRKSALALARKVLDEFETCDYVVAPSGSFAGMIRTHYPDLFSDQPAERNRAQSLCERTYELTDFLVNVAKFECVPGIFNGAVTYHDSCSGLRELGVRDQPRSLLAKVVGLTMREMDEAEVCCGFGGMFAVKFGDLSTHIADGKCDNIAVAAADCRRENTRRAWQDRRMHVHLRRA